MDDESGELISVLASDKVNYAAPDIGSEVLLQWVVLWASQSAT